MAKGFNRFRSGNFIDVWHNNNIIILRASQTLHNLIPCSGFILPGIGLARLNQRAIRLKGVLIKYWRNIVDDINNFIAKTVEFLNVKIKLASAFTRKGIKRFNNDKPVNNILKRVQTHFKQNIFIVV